MSGEIWLMDSDFCEECDRLLVYLEDLLLQEDEEWFWEMDMYDENQAAVYESPAEIPTQDAQVKESQPG